MDHVMKRIVSFLILLALFVVILTLPAHETPAIQHDSMPLWSVLLYLTVIITAGLGGLVIRKNEDAEQLGSLPAEPRTE